MVMAFFLFLNVFVFCRSLKSPFRRPWQHLSPFQDKISQKSKPKDRQKEEETIEESTEETIGGDILICFIKLQKVSQKLCFIFSVALKWEHFFWVLAFIKRFLVDLKFKT